MKPFAIRKCGGDCLGRTPGGGNSHQTCVGSIKDSVIRPPAPPIIPPLVFLTSQRTWGGPPRSEIFLNMPSWEMAVGLIGYPFAVGRKERPGCLLRTRDRNGLQFIHGAQIDLPGVTPPGNVEQLCPIGRELHRRFIIINDWSCGRLIANRLRGRSAGWLERQRAQTATAAMTAKRPARLQGTHRHQP